jgi:hypothetical protein
MKFKVEVRNPSNQEWVLIEMLESNVLEIRRYVKKIKAIYPEYFVRALDVLTLRTVVLV